VLDAICSPKICIFSWFSIEELEQLESRNPTKMIVTREMTGMIAAPVSWCRTLHQKSKHNAPTFRFL
jgi:hypothetical protein